MFFHSNVMWFTFGNEFLHHTAWVRGRIVASRACFARRKAARRDASLFREFRQNRCRLRVLMKRTGNVKVSRKGGEPNAQRERLTRREHSARVSSLDFVPRPDRLGDFLASL